ncbi:hypothetical protein [Microbacterium sp. EST19A]|uniref:hypothetical protein n=1 Tax=Microbacterium sp. EST19A TaxID=2862681 RepID=UPI001CBB4439|nr:hypothetical protein [Microbacterium sp. EST19A]
MRRRSLLILGAVALLLVSGCAPTPEPEPTASASPSPTPTPTVEPAVEPTPAFDVTCDDVAAEMTTLVGAPSGAVAETLSLVSAPNWYPGPAIHAFQRPGGIACSTGDDDRSWEITILPGAQAVTEGAASRGGYFGEEARCEDSGMCFFQLIEGEVLVSGLVVDPELAPGDAPRIEEGLRRLGASAVSTLRAVELAPSEIVGVECTRFLTAEETAEFVGGEAFLIDAFGGWGIPSEVYQVVNGSRICYYASGETEYESQGYLTITTLPGGAWAFERIEDGTAVDIEGADAALTGVDEFERPVLDLRIGTDWIRLTTYEGSGISDLVPLADQIVQNFTVGRPAPQ